jgi:hypothetical protein
VQASTLFTPALQKLLINNCDAYSAGDYFYKSTCARSKSLHLWRAAPLGAFDFESNFTLIRCDGRLGR